MIVKNVNVNKLHDEFISNGIKPSPVFKLDNGDGDFTFPEGTDMTAVQAVIDAHDPTPLPPQPTKEELLQKEIDELKAVVDTMLNGGDA